MISADYCRLMARYNSWQNTSLVTAADGLANSERWKDRGAFFRSIAATLNHIYWADGLWIERLKGTMRPREKPIHSLEHPSDWVEFKALRLRRNTEIEDWAGALRDTDLAGSITWYSAGGTVRNVTPKDVCAVQLFNHQTHHRGQVHAMLTAAGAVPQPTDLPVLDRQTG